MSPNDIIKLYKKYLDNLNNYKLIGGIRHKKEIEYFD